MMNASQIAKHVLHVAHEEGDQIDHLKLQKLLYYIQGLHLAEFGVPLFSEPIEAWDHGPVVRDVYHRYSEYKSSPIDKDEGYDPSATPFVVDAIVRQVQREYGKFASWKLRNMTHEEPPWLEARAETTGRPAAKLKHSTMTAFFRTADHGGLVLDTDAFPAELQELAAAMKPFKPGPDWAARMAEQFVLRDDS